jgi:hypothetical protein
MVHLGGPVRTELRVELFEEQVGNADDPSHA